MTFKYLIIATMLVLGVIIFSNTAKAHSIYIFAYYDGSQICTNSYFGGKAKVVGGVVQMINTKGETLATTQSDETGNACFNRPKEKQELVFTVEASGGHRAEFKLGSSDVPSQTETSDNNAAISIVSENLSESFLSADDLKNALAPIMQKLSEMESAQKSRIDLKEIIGGLGWLMGLFGVAFWAKGRKNKTKENN